MTTEAETTRPPADSMAEQLVRVRAFLVAERKARAAERAASAAQYRQVLELLSVYESALSAAPGSAPVDAQLLSPVSTLIQSLHATIDIQREALGDDMSVVYYARVVEAAHAYWDLQAEYGNDFQVTAGSSQIEAALKVLQGYIDLLDEHLAKGVPADSPFYEDRRILTDAVATLSGRMPCADSAPSTLAADGNT